MPSRRLPDEPNHVAHDYNPDDRALFREILRLNLKAAVLRSILKMDGEDTDSASEDEQSYTFLRQVKCLLPTSPKATLDLILQRSSPVDTEATRWGIEKEPVAKKAYQEELSFALCVRWHNQPSSDPANVLANKEPPVS
ncbi:unnamed protein product [Ixodes pacificus]